MKGIITITTDFGRSDPYVAAMKGRILSALPTCQMVDVTHEVSPGDILRGALAVRDVAPYFPEGTVHLVVVDPGVGTDRRAMIMEHRGTVAVGPDNGVLSLLWEGERDEATFFEIDQAAVASWPVSNTFHGRDLFAPAAALLAAGTPPDRIGERFDDPVELELPRPEVVGAKVVGEVLYSDRFGNLVTNVRRDMLPGPPKALVVRIRGRAIPGLSRTYAQSGPGPIALLGSTGFLEVAMPGGSAARELGAGFGDRVEVSVDASAFRGSGGGEG